MCLVFLYIIKSLGLQNVGTVDADFQNSVTQRKHLKAETHRPQRISE
jgi:hypothetical protein